MRALVATALLSIVAGNAHSQTTFNVTNSGFTAYVINAMQNPSLGLERGKTYTFNVNAVGHPFFIKTLASTGTGDRYDSGVTGQGATTSSVVFAVPLDAPDLLFYHCSIHSGMGGMLN